MPDPALRVLPDLLLLPGRVLSGPGRVAALWDEAASLGERGLLVYGRAARPRLDDLLARIPPSIHVTACAHKGGEPTLDEVDALRQSLRAGRADWIAAIGGGSVIDLAKGAAVLAHEPHPTRDYHDGAPILTDGLPVLAVPTTAGTGTEATINTVLTNPVTGSKKSIRDARMLPRTVILDPQLLATCPPAVIAASGLDAFTQAFEAFTSRGATALSDDLALQGLQRVSGNLEAVFADARDPRAEDLLAGSFLTGIALASARLGVVHGLAHPLGALFHVPHGRVCAACLPHAITFNRDAIGDKYERLSRGIGMDLQSRVAHLTHHLGLTSPFAGLTLPAPETLVAEVLASGSTRSNPRPVTAADVNWFLARLFAA